MAQNDLRDHVRALMRLAGITVPEDRIDALVMGLGGMNVSAQSLRKYDYGAKEPGFRVPMPSSGDGE